MANPEHVAKLKEGFDAWYKWRQANPDITPDLEGVDITANEFRGTALDDKDGDGCPFINLLYYNFRGARLQSANLQGARLSLASLQGAALCNANLSRTDLRRARLQEAGLSGAKLKNADLREAKVQRADLRGAELQEAILEEAEFQSAVLAFANFEGADLTNTNLEGADLQWAVFRNANFWKANLRGAYLRGANLESTNVTGVKFDRSSLQQNFQGIRVATCYGSQMFKSFAQDQDYIEELRASGWWGCAVFWIWLILADCGRSLLLAACWPLGLATLFGYIYYFCMGPSHFKVDHLPFELSSMIYYSFVTFTTLGFGDIKPIIPGAAALVMAEVIIGYVMLGLLISILANKVARRS